MSGDQISLVKNVGTDQVAIQTSENSLMVLQAGQQGPPGPVNAISGTGIVVQTALNTFVTRSVVAGSTGITVTNGDGVAGNVSLALAAVLVSIVAGTMNGVVIGNTTPAAGTFTTLSATGAATFADGSAANPSITFTSDPDTGMYRYGVNSLAFATTGVLRLGLDANGLYNYTNQFTFGASADVSLNREAANILAQRNSTNAQSLRVYGTYTDGSNYQRVTLSHASGSAQLAAEAAGTGGAAGRLRLTGGDLMFRVASTDVWNISSSNHLSPVTDNAYDLGAVAGRIRDTYIGGTLYVGATAAYLGSKVNIQQTATVTASATDVGVYIARIDQPASNSSSVSAGLFVESTFNAGTTVTGTTQHGIYGRVAMANSGTGSLTNARAFVAEVTQSNGARTTSVATGYYVATATVSAGTVTSFHGFYCLDQASANITTAYAYRGSMASGTNRWNLYLDGTAPNYFAGNIYAGTLTQIASERFALQASDASTSGSPRMIFARFTLNPGSASTMDAIVAQFRSSVTTNNGANARGIRADLETGASVTVPQWVGFEATTSLSVTAGVLTTGYGFFSQPGTNGTMGTWQSFCAAADGGNITNHYGFRGLIGSGSNKFNLYMDGTAQNYLAGFLGLGVTPPAASLDIGGNVSAASWTTNGIGLRIRGNTYTDTSTGVSGTAATNHIHAIAAPTLAATNATVTTTTAATLYIAGAPTAGTNMTITNGYALFVNNGDVNFGTGSGNVYRNRGGTYGQALLNGEIQNIVPSGISCSIRLIQTGIVDGRISNEATTGNLTFTAFASVEVKNSTTAQIFRVYNTYTNASNYERLAIQWSSNIAQITTQALGTGVTTRQMSIFTGGQAHVNLGTNGTTRWIIEGSSNLGHLIAATDNTYDIGTTSLRPRDIFSGRQIVVGAATDTFSSFYCSGTSFSASANIYGFRANVTAGSTQTGAWYGFLSSPVVGNFVFTIADVAGFVASNAAKGASATITNQTGFYIADLTVATNNFGIRGLVSAGANKWNLYLDGTANNLFGGYVSIGVTTPAATLDISMNATQGSWTTNGVGLRIRANTYTDSSTGVSGTAVTNHIHAIAVPTLAATNATVTTTTAATLYIAGAPTAGSNMTITNARALLVNAGTSEFGGQVLSAAGTSANPSFGFSTAANTGMYLSGGNTIVFSQGSNNVVGFQNSASVGVTIASTLPLAWNLAGQDLFLFRDAANSLGQRNGTNAQVFRVYNTYTDASNFERGAFSWSSNVLRIGTQVLGTGVSRPLTVTIGNTDVWTFNTTGHLSTATDNNYDLGTSSLRPRTAYIGTSLVVQGPTGFVNGVTITAVATTVSPTIVAAGSDANITLTISSKGTGDLKLDPASGDIQITKALVALGGGAAPTFGTIGGSGPATAAQNTWLRLKDSGGNAFWVPVWK